MQSRRAALAIAAELHQYQYKTVAPSCPTPKSLARKLLDSVFTVEQIVQAFRRT
jgi:hypothetical protein